MILVHCCPRITAVCRPLAVFLHQCKENQLLLQVFPHGGLWLLLLARQLILRPCPPGAELHLTLPGEAAREPVGGKIRQGVNL